MFSVLINVSSPWRAEELERKNFLVSRSQNYFGACSLNQILILNCSSVLKWQYKLYWSRSLENEIILAWKTLSY